MVETYQVDINQKRQGIAGYLFAIGGSTIASGVATHSVIVSVSTATATAGVLMFFDAVAKTACLRLEHSIGRRFDSIRPNRSTQVPNP